MSASRNSLSRNTATLKPGKSRTLTVVFNPTDCSDKEVEWLRNNTVWEQMPTSKRTFSKTTLGDKND